MNTSAPFEPLSQTTQDKLQTFLTAVGGMVQYAREDEAVQLQTVSPLSQVVITSLHCSYCNNCHSSCYTNCHVTANYVTPVNMVKCLREW